MCPGKLSITGCKVLSCCWTSGNLLYTLESSLFSLREHWKVLQCMVSKFSQTSTGEIKSPFVHIIKPPCSLVQLADCTPEKFRSKTAWVFLGHIENRLAELCQATPLSSWTRGSNPEMFWTVWVPQKTNLWLPFLFQEYYIPLQICMFKSCEMCAMSFALILLSLLSSILIDIIWLCEQHSLALASLTLFKSERKIFILPEY